MNKIIGLIVVALAIAGVASAAGPQPPAGFDAIVAHYETIRLSLANDRWDNQGKAAATELRGVSMALSHAPTSQAAGVPTEKLAAVKSLLAELDQAAAALVAAKDLEAARNAFSQLTTPLVRWRAMTSAGPAVAFCPMAKRSWLQPAEKEIGNPYLGKSMAKCGQLTK